MREAGCRWVSAVFSPEIDLHQRPFALDLTTNRIKADQLDAFQAGNHLIKSDWIRNNKTPGWIGAIYRLNAHSNSLINDKTQPKIKSISRPEVQAFPKKI